MVENWPGTKPLLGKALIADLREQAETFGAEFLADIAQKVDLSTWPFTIYTEDGKVLHALTLIISTGASPKLLNIPGEKEYWGKGVSTCAVCDAPFYKGKDVVVVGGGDSALEEAMQLAAYAKKVTIIVRKDAMRASAHGQELLTAYKNVDIKWNSEIKQVTGDDDKVTSIDLYDNKNDTTTPMPINGVFLAIGHDPNTALFKDTLAMNENGYLTMTDRSQATSVPGIYAAGDVEDNRYRQAGVASGSGIKAALDALAFLSEIGFNADKAAQLQKKQACGATQDTCIAKDPEPKEALEPIGCLADFDASLKQADILIADFYTDTCPSCEQVLSMLEAYSKEAGNQVKIIKVNAETAGEVASKWHVFNVPAVLIFHKGSLAARFAKQVGKKELAEVIARILGK